MTRSIDEANQYISFVRHMPNGPAKSAAALAEVGRVDAEGPPEAKAYALHALIEAYVFGDGQDKAIVPFTQAIALYDAHPEWFDEADRYNLFWSFKWMVSDLRRFPNVTLTQLEATLAEMERRYALEGFTMHAPYQHRWLLARHRGAEDAPELYDRWLLQTRDEMSDCELCAPGDRVESMIENGRLDDGLTLMESIFADETIRQECFSEPASMLSMAQFAYVQRGHPGDATKAAAAHRRCRSYLGGATLRQVESHDASRTEERRYALAEERGRCVEFLARTGNEDAAVRLLEDYRGFLVHAESPLDRLDFLRHVGAALHVLVDDDDMGSQAIALKAPLPSTLGELWQWVRGQAEALAAEFDARNGTTHQADLLREAWTTSAYPGRLDMRVVPAVEPASVVSASDETASDDETETTADPSRLVRQAEKLVATHETEVAIDSYLTAAARFEQLGRLSDAGFARAEAGYLALTLDDLDGAEQCLGRAAQLLKAAATPVRFASPVSVVLAECLSRRGQAGRADAILDEQATLLDAALAAPDADEQSEGVAQVVMDDLRWARTRVDEARAMMLLNGGDASGAALAQRAAESYASLGMVEPAAQAFHLAGRGWTDVDDDKAVWCLQSALEGYKIVLRRQPRLVVANQLVTLLQRLGRDDEAAQVTANL